MTGQGEGLRARLAELIWNTSRADEGTISATGANHVADAILRDGLLVPVGPLREIAEEWDEKGEGHGARAMSGKASTGEALMQAAAGGARKCSADDLRALLDRLTTPTAEEADR